MLSFPKQFRCFAELVEAAPAHSRTREYFTGVTGAPRQLWTSISHEGYVLFSSALYTNYTVYNVE